MNTDRQDGETWGRISQPTERSLTQEVAERAHCNFGMGYAERGIRRVRACFLVAGSTNFVEDNQIKSLRN